MATEEIIALTAGPLFVDLHTDATHPPDGDYHTNLTARKARRGNATPGWGARREVGASAFKFATSWAQDGPGPAIFVGRLPKPLRVPPGSDPHPAWKEKAFVDDAAWLAAEVKKAQTTRFTPEVTQGDTETSYTFHLHHPEQKLEHPWPIFSVEGGSSPALNWNHVRKAWKKNQDAITSRRAIIYLGGVLRTRLLQTLAKALKDGDDADDRHARTSDMLDHARLVIEFGRTDLRMPLPEKLRDAVAPCVLAASLVMVDFSTAQTLHLLEREALPRDYLVLRPHGPLAGKWWYFRRSGTGIERQRFDAPAPMTPSTTGGDDGEGTGEHAARRPARVAALVKELLTEHPDPNNWVPYLDDENQFRTPEEITEDPGLGRKLKELAHEIELKQVDAPLLLAGPTGTGKELVARWIHRTHPRRKLVPFQAVLCGRLEGSLVESELFGHVEGAFTHATGNRDGAFVSAHHGVLLIDDLDALSLETQAKILRVIEYKDLTPVGSNKARQVDVLLIVTTNVEPRELVRRGKLRSDLYYRFLAGQRLDLLPLAQRRCDARRALRAAWGRRNLAFSKNYELPETLLRWVNSAPLGGNFRAVDGAAKMTHKLARLEERAGGAPDASFPIATERLDQFELPAIDETGLSAIAGELRELREQVADRADGLRSAPGGGTSRPDRPGGFTHLKTRAAEDDVASPDKISERLNLFLALWADERAQDPEITDALRRVELAELLEVGPGDSRKLGSALARSRDSGHSPRVEPTHGKSARWRLVGD